MRRRGWMTDAECLPWPNGLQHLLVRAAVGADEEVIPAFQSWRRLVDLDGSIDAGSFRLLPLVFARLLAQRSDDALMGRLKGIYRKSWSETQAMLHATAPAVAALEAEGVRTMLLKGAPLALGMYPSPALRPMMDLDILVRMADVKRAIRILYAHGWAEAMRQPPEERPEAHSVELTSAQAHDIDLHWHSLRDTPAPIADAWFWQGAEPLDFLGVRTLQPRPTAQLLHAIIHGVRSNREPPVRWIADAMSILQTKADAIDWADLCGFARRQKLSYRLQLGLSFLAVHHRAAVPQAALDDLRASGISLVERIENIVYLGAPQQMYRPYLYPLVDYVRYSRNMPPGAFLRGYASCIQRRWHLGHPAQIPVAALAAGGRAAARVFARAAAAR